MEIEQLGDLRDAIGRNVTQPHLLQIYMDSISELQKSFSLAYSGVFWTLESSDVFILLFRVSLAWSYIEMNEFGMFNDHYGLQTVNHTTFERRYKRSAFDYVDFFYQYI